MGAAEDDPLVVRDQTFADGRIWRIPIQLMSLMAFAFYVGIDVVGEGSVGAATSLESSSPMELATPERHHAMSQLALRSRLACAVQDAPGWVADSSCEAAAEPWACDASCGAGTWCGELCGWACDSPSGAAPCIYSTLANLSDTCSRISDRKASRAAIQLPQRDAARRPRRTEEAPRCDLRPRRSRSARSTREADTRWKRPAARSSSRLETPPPRARARRSNGAITALPRSRVLPWSRPRSRATTTSTSSAPSASWTWSRSSARGKGVSADLGVTFVLKYFAATSPRERARASP